MKPYVVTTGLVFALLFCAHVARVFAEGFGVVRNPLFVITTLIALALFLWALRVLVVLNRQPH